MLTDQESEALAFLRNANSFESLEALQAAFRRVVSLYGITAFNVTRVNAVNTRPELKPMFGLGFDPWDVEYARQGYFPHDPCIPRFFSKPGSFLWSEVEPLTRTQKGKRMFEQTREIGARDGMIVPVYGGAGEDLCVRMMLSEKDIGPADRAIMEALATVYGNAGMRLCERLDDQPTQTPMTRREGTCLYWSGQGKSDADVALLLGIAPSTVHNHIEAAKRKIGAHSRKIAYDLALARGWLSDIV